jgi:hypothetical protein
MTAIVLPDVDSSVIAELRKHIPSLSEIEIPSLQEAGTKVGRNADQTIDRLLGRSRTPVWPWVAAGVFVVGLIGTVAAFLTWNRRASWTRHRDPWAEDSDVVHTSVDLSGTTLMDPPAGAGLTAAEASLVSDDTYGNPST